MPIEIGVGPPLLRINQGAMFVVTGLDGQIDADTELALYTDDTRFVSYWAIVADGEPWLCLTSAATASAPSFPAE